jgi:acyl-homoserine-lactone acylase
MLSAPSARSQDGTDDPWSNATLYRDAWGVPHIHGANLRAAAFAFGYAQAEDHLVDMLMAYRMAVGRAAEVSGEDLVPSDEFALKMGHGDLAAAYLTTGDVITLDLCEGFAMGVNQWMSDYPDDVPPWAEAVTAEKPLALLHYYLTSYAPFDLPGVWRPDRPAYSGNAFAIGPERSTSGKAMLAINPHTYYDGPFQWYEAHLMVEPMNLYGATLFGLPMLLQGHNAVLGWALTPNEADVGDIYLTPRPMAPQSAPNQLVNTLESVGAEALWAGYLLENTRTMYVRTANGQEPRAVQCLSAAQGPVIAEAEGLFAAYRVGGYGALGGLRQLVAMGSAQNLNDFQESLAQRQIPAFHITYADAMGDIFYLYNATVGMKRSSAGPALEWMTPLGGNDPYFQWGETVPLEWLPSVVNPASGYVQASGSPPWFAAGTSSPQAGDFPPWLIRDANSPRAERVSRMLSLGRRSFRDAQSMLFDLLVPAAVDAVPRLVAAAENNPLILMGTHPDTQDAIILLSQWNYVADVNSAAMTYFDTWWQILQEETVGVVYDEWALMELIQGQDPEVDDLLLETASQAAQRIKNEFGSLNVPWGGLHQIRRGNRVEALPGAAAGGTVWAGEGLGGEAGAGPTGYGYGYAMVVEFGATPHGASIVPFGSSQNMNSIHYDDQMDMYLRRAFKPVRFTLDDVQRHSVSAAGRSLLISAPGVDGQLALRTDRPVKARLMASASSADPLPSGLTNFSLFLTPEFETPFGEAIIDFDLYVPEVLCRDEDLGELSLYALDAVKGWVPLADQLLDAESRSLLGRDFQPSTYAILGPSKFLQHEPDTSDADGSDTDRLRVARGESPSVADLGVYAPLEPVQKTPQQRGELPTILGMPGQQLIGTQPVGPPKEEKPVDTSIVVIPPGSTTPVYGVPADDPEAPADNESVLAARSGAEAGNDAAGTPEEMAIETDAVGDVYTGKEVELRPPGVKALIVVTSPSTIQARSAVLTQAPLPFPKGLKAFTKVVGAEHYPEEARTEVIVSMTIDEAACSAAHLEKLSIYACDSANGWVQLQGQKLTADRRSLMAFDGRPRVYATLGPPE